VYRCHFKHFRVSLVLMLTSRLTDLVLTYTHSWEIKIGQAKKGKIFSDLNHI